MVVAKAYQSVRMALDSDSYLPPTAEALQDGVFTPTRIDVLDPLGRLQSYFGTFDLLALLQQDYSTSTFTGYKQYAGPVADEAGLQYEVSGASINGDVIYGFIISQDPIGLLAELFKGSDQITGSPEDDQLIGFEGADTMKGGSGSDELFGDDGDDLIGGNQGEDLLVGGLGNDFLRGGQDDDQLFGEDGDDRLNGNRGDDILSGGIGADIFMLSKGFDLIVDFDAAEGDVLEILASSGPYELGSTGPDGSGDLQIIRDVGITTLLGVSLASFNADTSIVLI